MLIWHRVQRLMNVGEHQQRGGFLPGTTKMLSSPRSLKDLYYKYVWTCWRVSWEVARSKICRPPAQARWGKVHVISLSPGHLVLLPLLWIWPCQKTPVGNNPEHWAGGISANQVRCPTTVDSFRAEKYPWNLTKEGRKGVQRTGTELLSITFFSPVMHLTVTPVVKRARCCPEVSRMIWCLMEFTQPKDVCCIISTYEEMEAQKVYFILLNKVCNR